MGLGYNTFVVEHAQEELLNTRSRNYRHIIAKCFSMAKRTTLTKTPLLEKLLMYIKLNKFPFCSFSDFIGLAHQGKDRYCV
jgi:hypothetical protein